MVTGRDLILQLDGDIEALRYRLRDAIQHADDAAVEETHLRDAQLQQYAKLADIRLDFIQQEGARASLDRAHREAMSLLSDHEKFVEEAASKLKAVSDEISALERKRAQLAADHDGATDAYDERVQQIEHELSTDENYQQLLESHQSALAVASRAAQKYDLAEEDRQTKGEPYDGDPLFSYLWKRRFKTPAYKAGPLFRMLDGWVADLCKYDRSYLNYQRLTELPVRLAEHVDFVEDKADHAMGLLEAAEDKALDEGGASVLREKAEALAKQLESLDDQIVATENRHRDLSERHDKAMRSEEGPVVRARKMLEQSVSKASVPSLRVMASETLSLEDDQIVDLLVQMRADESVLERDTRAATQRVGKLRKDLAEMEECRRRTKSSRLDSPYVVYRESVVDDVLRQLERGVLRGVEAFDRLKRAARRSGNRSTGFGGRRRTRTMGVPEILGDVMWEVAREAMRQGSSGSWGSWGSYGGPRRSRPSVRMPRSSGRRRSGGGGFKTGGGF